MSLYFYLMQETVQGRMMEQVVSCKDEIAQQYLMQCIIQGFPDEFHLGTLTTLLSSLPELQSGVKSTPHCGVLARSDLTRCDPAICTKPLHRPSFQLLQHICTVEPLLLCVKFGDARPRARFVMCRFAASDACCSQPVQRVWTHLASSWVQPSPHLRAA